MEALVFARLAIAVGYEAAKFIQQLHEQGKPVTATEIDALDKLIDTDAAALLGPRRSDAPAAPGA